MTEKNKILLIVEDIFKSSDPEDTPFANDQVWIDRLSGGLLSQYLRKVRVSKDILEIPNLVWLKGTNSEYSDIFICGEANEVPFSQIAKVVGDSKNKKCEWMGDLDSEIQKKAKRYFLEIEQINQHLAWTEDLK